MTVVLIEAQLAIVHTEAHMATVVEAHTVWYLFLSRHT
jgi:hypothetical protein